MEGLRKPFAAIPLRNALRKEKIDVPERLCAAMSLSSAVTYSLSLVEKQRQTVGDSHQ
jgi:hypothetical protein